MKINNFKTVFTKVNKITKETTSISIEKIQNTIDIFTMMHIANNQANEYIKMMDCILDPMDLNDLFNEIKINLTNLENAETINKISLINEIIKQLKECKPIIKRLDKYKEEENHA